MAERVYSQGELIGVLTTEPLGRVLDYRAPEGGCGTGDFVEARRKLRQVVIPASAAYIGLNGMAHFVDPGGPQGLAASMFSALILALLGFAVAWSMFAVSGVEQIFAVSKADDQTAVRRETDAADQLVINEITHSMAVERIYRQDGMSIRQLSETQQVPEDRLRRLLYQELGYRTFNAFLNSYSIAEAKAALADPGQDDVPILTIARDAGFRSLRRFNHAFATDVGMKPSEFRNRRAV